MSKEDLHKWYYSMLDILEHNRELMKVYPIQYNEAQQLIYKNIYEKGLNRYLYMSVGTILGVVDFLERPNLLEMTLKLSYFSYQSQISDVLKEVKIFT